MKDIREYLNSGIIESYVLGMTTSEENKEVEEFSIIHTEVREAIELFSEAMEQQALSNEIKPSPTIKPLLMATINFLERMEKGEPTSFPPDIDEGSKVSDYDEWLSRPDFVLPTYVADMHARLISHTSKVTTAIVWIKEMAPQEVHHDEYEKFLIVEGTCDITIEENVHHLKRGDFLAIPLHKKHIVKVTSAIPCKAILQRVAA